MSDQDDVRSPRDVDADAERFVDEVDNGATSAVDLSADGSIADIIDQHTEVPEDDEA